MTKRAKPASKLANLERRHIGQRLIAMLLAGSALTVPQAALAQTATWNGNASGDFGTAENWSTGAVPGNANTATVDGAGGPNQPTVNNPQSVALTSVTGGSLTLASTLTSPTTAVSGTGNLVILNTGTLTGDLNVTGAGTVNNAGAINGTVSHSGATFTNAGSISGLFVNLANFTSTGTINGGLDNVAGGTANLAGALGGPVTNAGALIVGGNLTSSGGRVTNQGTGTLVINAGANWTGVGEVTTGSSAVDGILIGGSLSLVPTAGFRVNEGALVRVATGGTLSLDNPANGSGADRIILASNARFRNEGTVNAAITSVIGSSGGEFVNEGLWNGSLLVSEGHSGVNNGTWILPDVVGLADSAIRGRFVNNGSLNGQIVVDRAGGETINLGTVENTLLGSVSRATTGGIIDNRASWTGNLVARTNGIVRNSGTITGAIVNEATGTLTSTGTITAGLDNSAAATISGTLGGPINNLAGTLTVNGALSSNGALLNSGTGRIVVNAGAVWSGLTAISNAAQLDNSGTIVGRIVNTVDGSLTSTGSITAGLENAGNANIGGTIIGSIDNTAGTLGINGTALSDGALTNSGNGVVNVGLGATWTGLAGIENRSTAEVGMVVVGDLTTGGIFRTSSNVVGNPPAVVDVDGGTLTILAGGQLIIGDTISPFGVDTPGSGILQVSRNAAFESNGTLDVQGTLSIGAAFEATGLLEITGGGLARAASLCLGCGNASFAGTGELTVDDTNGFGARFEFTSVNGQLAVGNGTAGGGVGRIIVRNGGSWARTTASTFGMSIASGSSLLVTGLGSTFDLPSPLVAGGSVTFEDRAQGTIGSLELQDGTMRVLGGAMLSQTDGNVANWSFGQQARVLIAGRDTHVTVNGALSIGSSNVGEGSGDFIVEDGAVLSVLGSSPSGLANGENRNLIIRSGAQATLAGGLSVNRGTVLLQDASLAMSGPMDMNGNFAGNALTLFNASFSASSISANANAVHGNSIINLGGTATGAAGAVGSFDVGQITLAGSGNIASQFIINHTATDFVIGSNFIGFGGIIRHLAGDTIFTGNQSDASYSGQTLLTGGTLSVNGTHGNNAHVMTVSGGAVLGGSGRINGTVTIGNATLAAGNSPGTLTFGNDLMLGAGSILAFELGAPGGVAGVDSDLVTVGRNLTLDGTLDVIDAGGFGEGLYRLFNYGGALTDNGLELGALPTGVTPASLAIQTSVANQVNLIFAEGGTTPPDAPTSFPFWDGSATMANGQIEGGSGTWTTTSANWTTTAATANGAFNPEDLLIFTGSMPGEEEQVQGATFARLAPQITAALPSASAGTVTVDASEGAITLENGMQFAVTGYTLTGDDIVLAATEPCGECSPLPGQTIVRVGDGTDASASFVATIESRLVGESGLLKTDRGTLILSGANSYSGGTEIADGMLQGDATSLQGDIAVGSGGILLFTQGDAGTYEGTLSGAGIVAKQGAGMLRLTGESFAFDGTASLTEGELAVDGALGSALFTLEAGAAATLSGAGRIGGSVVVEDATVSPGGNPIERVELRFAAAAAAAAVSAAAPANPVGLLTIDGDFSLTSASILAFQLGDPAVEAGLASDLINVGGNLTLDGTLDVTDAGGFGAGLYRLINYGGTLIDNALVVGTTPEGFTPADLTVQTSVANQVNLLVATPVTSFTFWDGANIASDSTVNGGTATWRADTTNWTIADGTRNGVVDPAQLLIFAGTAGTVTVDNAGGPVRATAGLQFATNGYRIEGGAIALDGATATMRVGDGTTAGAGFTATVASALTGSASLEKTDLGTLVLSGMNTYAGGTRVLGGTLQIADNAALGASQGGVTLDFGTLRATAALSSARNFAIGNSGGTIDSGTNALTLSGSLSGTGNLRLVGSGARTLSGNSSTLLGNTTLSAGSLVLTGSLGGRLSVAAPAMLTGTGRAGNLDLSGTFSPGAATGNTATFTLTGDFVVRAGSTLQVDVVASGAADRVEVGGRALLEGGTVAINTLDPDLNYTNGTVYRIVNATGGLTGTFAGLTETSAFLDFALGYDPTGAFLTTTVIRQFPDVAETFNQIQAASALMDLGRVSGSNALATYNAILLLSAEPARAAFDATSGEIYPTLLASRQRAGLALAGRIAMRGRAGGNEGLALWGGVLGDRGHVDGDGNGARSTADGFGWESGLDYRGTDNQWALGFGGGWQEGDVTLRGRGSRSKTDAWHIGGYARYGSGGTGFSMVASLAHADADASVTRQIGFGTVSRTAVSQVDLRTTAASGEMRFGLGNGALAVGPLASVDHASTRLSRVAETGAGALNLSGAGKREGWTRFGIGGFARYGLGSGFADVALRYVHRSRGATQIDLSMEGSPTGHAVRAAGGSRVAVRVDASSEFSIGNRWAISGNLGATHADKEGQIDGSVRLSYRF